MATIAVGDIHGNLPALEDLLGQLSAEVAGGDTVVFLGDYIDRGPASRRCVEAILQFRQQTAAAVVCLRGNHEDWLLRTRSDFAEHTWVLATEAFETMQSYSPEAARDIRAAKAAAGLQLYIGHCVLPYDLFFDRVPETHHAFFDSLAPFYRGPDGVCVHGGVDPAIPRLEDQPLRALMWGTEGFPGTYQGAETLAYGHWNNAVLDGRGWPMPRVVGVTIGLDTIAHGVLSAVRLADRRLFQSARYEIDAEADDD